MTIAHFFYMEAHEGRAVLEWGRDEKDGTKEPAAWIARFRRRYVLCFKDADAIGMIGARVRVSAVLGDSAGLKDKLKARRGRLAWVVR